MEKKYIVKKNYEIQKIISEKKSIANKYFIVYKKKNNISHFRIVISIGKKIGKAVLRNKLKRQIKTIIYQKKHEITENYDILLIVRESIKDLSYDEIQKQIFHVFEKANLITQ